MQRSDFEKYLNNYLNVDQIQDYCPNGLQVEGKETIKKVATAVSANLMTVEKAIEAEVDALLTHHGMFWSRDPYPIRGSKKKKVELLLKHQLSLFAYHLPLDAHREVGNNWQAARDLDWEDLEPFGVFNGTEIGVRVTFALQSIEAFVAKV